MSQARLDLLFFRRVWRLFGILFEKYNSRSALIFYVLVILSILLQFVIYAAGLVPSKFFEVLGSKDVDAFPHLSIYAILVIVLNAVMKSMLNYVSRVLYLTWRQRLCSKLHEKYFGKMMFYQLNILDNSLDNMDQRITRDANLFAKEWSTLMAKWVVLPFTMVYYSYQCFISTTWLGPVIIYVYFIVGTIVNRIIMSPIIRLNVDQEIWEGNYRYQHLNVRVNSESMAFYRAGDIEYTKSNSKLGTLLKTQMSLFNWSFWLNSAVNIFDYVGGILSYLVIAIPIFAGLYDDLSAEELSALISRNSFVCIYLIHTFSQLIDMSGIVGDMAAHTHRLAQVFETIDEKNKSIDDDSSDLAYDNDAYNDEDQCLVGDNFPNVEFDAKPKENQSSSIAFEKDDPSSNGVNENELKTYFTLSNVTFFTPDNTVMLINCLTLSIEEGKNILVSGPTGCGKTTFLRVLAGLCAPTSGSVKRWINFGPRGVMYLPQKPLMTDGTLNDQITYPRSRPYPEYSERNNRERVEKVCNEVELNGLIDNYGGLQQKSEANWSDKLSMGEMQRLSFARLLYHHPNLAVMDEPTSGLTEQTENLLFDLCRKRKITCVTVGHRRNLKQFHDYELQFFGNGKWDFISLSGCRSTQF